MRSELLRQDHRSSLLEVVSRWATIQPFVIVLVGPVNLGFVLGDDAQGDAATGAEIVENTCGDGVADKLHGLLLRQAVLVALLEDRHGGERPGTHCDVPTRRRKSAEKAVPCVKKRDYAEGRRKKDGTASDDVREGVGGAVGVDGVEVGPVDINATENECRRNVALVLEEHALEHCEGGVDAALAARGEAVELELGRNVHGGHLGVGGGAGTAAHDVGSDVVNFHAVLFEDGASGSRASVGTEDDAAVIDDAADGGACFAGLGSRKAVLLERSIPEAVIEGEAGHVCLVFRFRCSIGVWLK
mmetsp:Transcript_22060/g.54578  ORF Transcript_22060/g.54578 Transcript_22060/m.54578 type:complete len:301 (+) Transcript_22060:1024-1926(+)